jgi:predicted acyl esterase
LAGNLYMPDAGGRFPGLLMYTPYLKDGPGGRGPAEVVQTFLARRGYVCLTLDRRGFGASEGRADPPFSPIERQDGVDAVAWMAEQPWCTGETGMWGISYGGDTALSVASAQPPSLRAIVAIHATDDEFTGVCYPHGCRGGLWSEIDWGFRMLGLQLLPPLPLNDCPEWKRLWQNRLEGLDPWLFTWHTIAPSTWAAWRTDVSKVRAAVYMVSAWHDCYPAEMLRMYGRLSAPKRLLIGPWKHELPDRAVNRPIGFAHEMARWFDHWLKNHDTGMMDEPPVILYDQPDGWRAVARWPSPACTEARYYLQTGGGLGTDGPLAGGADTYRVDPSVGLYHLAWDWTTPATTVPADISPDDHRALTYTTEPLPTDLAIDGQPELIVHLSADQTDFPLAAWLSDVSPNGFSTLICQGWIRPVHVVGRSLEAGRVYELRVSLFPTSYRVAAGHRLRLAIAGSHFPVLVPAPVNPTLTVHRSDDRPSRLLLPVGEASPRRASGPVFQQPLGEDPKALILRESDHVLNRDLSGRNASHQLRQREVHSLEGGTTLRTDMETSATIAVGAPGGVRFLGTRTITVEGPGRTIIVRTGVTETFDHCHLTAEIAVDGKAFFNRSWDLDLRGSEWNVKGTVDSGHPERGPHR